MAAPHLSLRVARGHHVLNSHLLRLYNSSVGDGKATELPKMPILESTPKDGDPLSKSAGSVCIIGAGVAGLYAAMTLWDQGVQDITILEASDRVGGRTYTHQFAPDPHCAHNYYDMGAMRIPEIPSMQPTFKLIEQLRDAVPPLKNPPQKLKYMYKNKQVPNVYYYKSASPDEGPFTKRIEWLLAKYCFNTAKTQEDLEVAFKKYFADPHGWDNYSCRAWMMASFPDLESQFPNPMDPDPAGPLPPPLTFKETQVGEMAETSSGLLDQALTEMMIDYSDFQAASGQDWFRIEGTTDDPNNPLTGMSALSEAMREYLVNKGCPEVALNSPVVQMSETGDDQITVTWGSTVETQQSKNFNTVIATPALGCLQRMDLEGLNLSDDVLMGIRTLAYDRATKVAIKFNERWWMNFGITDLGGVSSSDLPISNVVYPSWDDGDSSQNYILMASYSWAQDATRMASLVKDYPDAEVKDIHDPLVTLCLQNLVKLFQANGHTDVTYDYLRKKYISHHAWSWSHDPWTAGAFALFGPGQFSNIYQSFFTEPLCGGKLLIAGEALSVHHAWISGAIDSAFIKVTQLAMAKRGKYGAAKMKKSVYGGGVGEMPHELDETLLYWSVELNKKTLEKKGVS